MSYPLIVFGAGASHDSLQKGEIPNSIEFQLSAFRPSLSNDILKRNYWDSHISRWQHMQDLATDVVGGIKRFGSLELYLTHLKKNVLPRNKKRAEELLVFRYYLADLFKDISNKYHHKASNYLALIKRLEDECDTKALVINFNYDVLFENFIWDHSNISVDSYVRDSIKVIKVHGACHWVYEPEVIRDSFHKILHKPQIDGVNYYLPRAYEIISNNIYYKDIMQTTHLESWQYLKEDYNDEFQYYIPALTIPLSVDKSHCCPDSHIEVLTRELNNIDRILIIGWRAEDPFLVEVLNKFEWQRKIPIYIVSSKYESALNISKKFINSSFLLKPCTSEGFSGFIGNKEFDNFWQETN